MTSENKKTLCIYCSSSNDLPEKFYKISKDLGISLAEKGYNPVSQIVGYILSEDPAYITTYNNARNNIMKIDRYELLQSLLQVQRPCAVPLKAPKASICSFYRPILR